MDSFTRQKYSTRFRDANKTDISTAKGPPVRPVTSRTWQASMQHPPPSPAPDSSVAVYTNELYSSKRPPPSAASSAGSMHPTYSPLSARRPATSTRRPTTGSAPPPSSRGAGDSGASARATVRRAPGTARGPPLPSMAEHLFAPGGASTARYDAPPLSAHVSVASLVSAREVFGKTAPQSSGLAEAVGGTKPAPSSSSASARALPTTRASLRPATAAAGTLDAAPSAKGSILAAAAAARPATSGLISARRPMGAVGGGGGEVAEGELGPAQAALAAAAMSGRTNILRQLLFQPSPQSRPFFCRLQRKRAGIFRSHCMYHLSLEQGTVPLLFALRKKSKAGAIKYLISTQADDFAATSPCRMGKLVANFLGTEFVLQLPASTRSAPPTELASIAFQSNGIGSKGPRKIHVTVPSMDVIAKAMGADASKAAIAARLSSLPSVGAAKLKDKSSQELTVLKNKPPRWNDSLQAYCLNFNGRVTQASVKNFQLAADADPDTTVLQFGRVAADAFTMDCIYPLSILQAFAICLTSFESKLTCE